MEYLGAGTYLLCFVTSLTCMALLARGYARSRSRLLLWSALCFVGLAFNNLMLFVDLAVLPTVDLRPFRYATSLFAVGVLVVGLVLETD